MKKITLRSSSMRLLPNDESQFSIDYQNELNESQLKAVRHIDGPALVIAGAGTGKTRTLTYRVARLIEQGVPPESILLLTFTRKAAREMLRRAAILLDERSDRVSGGTFHSFANKVLRQYSALVGLASNFTILDQGDSEDVINVLRTRLGLAGKNQRFPKKQTLWKMYSSSVNTLTALEHVIMQDYPQFKELSDDIHSLVKAYITYKMQNNAVDYDDLLVHIVALLESNDAARKKLSALYRYVMVDEYQDTNALQARIVKLLAGDKGNVMVVGDDAQSIYSFRGANFRNIMDFPKQFAGTTVITLEQNFRSSQPILDLTNEVILHSVEKYQKELFTEIPGGEAPLLIAVESENTQSRLIAQEVLDTREEGVPLSEMAVLFRAGFQSYDLEIELAKANIPFRKFGGLKLMETAHIKDLIAHLRVLENPKDIISWTRILLLLEGVGPVSAERITDEIMKGLNPLSSSSNSRMDQINSNDSVQRLLSTLRPLSKSKSSVGDILAAILAYYLPLMKGIYDDYPKRTRDLDMLLTISERYTNVQSFLTDMALEPPNESVEGLEAGGSEDEFLTLSTIHSAKGLEWHSVFVIHLVDGRFPMPSATESIEEMEEERRLFYVACTRAKRKLYLIYPTNIYDRSTGRILSKPSRFLDGVPDTLLERAVVEEE
jgi:ATP-dependent DNA helicase UvrD/PcrA